MLNTFKCNYCNNNLSIVNYNDPESFEDLVHSVVNSTSFSCSCGSEYRFGLFDLKTYKPVTPKLTEYDY